MTHRGIHESLRNQPGHEQVRGAKAEVRLPSGAPLPIDLRDGREGE
jgi:hypothetical protein